LYINYCISYAILNFKKKFYMFSGRRRPRRVHDKFNQIPLNIRNRFWIVLRSYLKLYANLMKNWRQQTIIVNIFWRYAVYIPSLRNVNMCLFAKKIDWKCDDLSLYIMSPLTSVNNHSMSVFLQFLIFD